MNDAPTLRLLGPTDAPAYKRLRDLVLARHPAAFTSDADTERARPADSYVDRLGIGESPAAQTLGAWNAGTLCGAVTCERDRRVKASHIGHLVGMMVAPGAEGRGIGRAMLDALLHRLREAGDLAQLTLSVTADNARAIALYRDAGFLRYGTLPRAIRVGGRFHDKDLMALALDEPAGG